MILFFLSHYQVLVPGTAPLMAAAQFSEETRLCTAALSQPMAKASKSILKQEINFLHHFYSEEHKLMNDV